MHFMHILIRLLHGRIELELKLLGHIKNRHTFPKVIGATDGTHIKIDAPKSNPDCYVNRKGYHSIQLQVFFSIVKIY